MGEREVDVTGTASAASSRHSTGAIVLHWAIALLVLVQLPLGSSSPAIGTVGATAVAGRSADREGPAEDRLAQAAATGATATPTPTPTPRPSTHPSSQQQPAAAGDGSPAAPEAPEAAGQTTAAGGTAPAGSGAATDVAPSSATPAPADPVDVELAPSPLEQEAEAMAEGGAAATASPPSAAQWLVDRAQSRVGFSFALQRQPVSGAIADWRADILFDPDSLETSSISVVMETRTVSVDTREIDERQLASKDGFYAEYFGAANFTADSIRRRADGGYEAEGTLTIKGISRPLTLPFELSVENGVGRASGAVTIDRFDYEIGVANDPDATWIDREITISIDIVAEAPAR